MMDTDVSRTTLQRAGTSHPSHSSEKPGQVTAVEHSRIAQRAYELYVKRGRQDGQALEDWLSAERQMAGAAGK